MRTVPSTFAVMNDFPSGVTTTARTPFAGTCTLDLGEHGSAFFALADVVTKSPATTHPNQCLRMLPPCVALDDAPMRCVGQHPRGVHVWRGACILRDAGAKGTMVDFHGRPVWAEIDLDALAHNVRTL